MIDFEEVIFTKGTTESLNLLAYALEENISKHNEIIVTEMEHHSNFVPWLMLSRRTGCKLKIWKIDENG